MTDRRRLLADAAVRVVAREGLRGLTHRAVDAEAGLPTGSASNVFRTRDALLEGVGNHLVAVDVGAWGGYSLQPPATVDDLALRLSGLVAGVCAADPDAVRARFVVFASAPAAFADHHAHLRAELVTILAGLPVAEPERRAGLVMDLLDGAMLHAVTVRAGHPVAARDLAQALRALLV